MPSSAASAGTDARLRAYDAVHLAALHVFSQRDAAGQRQEPIELAFACWDTDLRRAAGALGFQLLPV